MARREALGALISGSVVAALVDMTKGGSVLAEEVRPSGGGIPQFAPAYRGTHQVNPPQFDAAKLRGLSEKLIPSHHQNNYSGAVS